MKNVLAGIMLVLMVLVIGNAVSALTVTVKCTKLLSFPVPNATVEFYYRYMEGDSEEMGSFWGTADDKGLCKIENLPNLTWAQALAHKTTDGWSAPSAERYDIIHDTVIYCNTGYIKKQLPVKSKLKRLN
jgi:hypothetical protein